MDRHGKVRAAGGTRIFLGSICIGLAVLAFMMMGAGSSLMRDVAATNGILLLGFFPVFLLGELMGRIVAPVLLVIGSFLWLTGSGARQAHRHAVAGGDDHDVVSPRQGGHPILGIILLLVGGFGILNNRIDPFHMLWVFGPRVITQSPITLLISLLGYLLALMGIVLIYRAMSSRLRASGRIGSLRRLSREQRHW